MRISSFQRQSLCMYKKIFSNKALNFQGKIWIIIGMVVFDVEPIRKHLHPLLFHVFTLLYVIILQNNATKFPEHRWLITADFLHGWICYFFSCLKILNLLWETFRKLVKEAFYLTEFVNPRNDWEIEMKPS